MIRKMIQTFKDTIFKMVKFRNSNINEEILHKNLEYFDTFMRDVLQDLDHDQITIKELTDQIEVMSIMLNSFANTLKKDFAYADKIINGGIQ